MTTQLTRPEPLEIEITAAEYENLENWLPMKLAELEHIEENQQRLAWWQEYGIRSVQFGSIIRNLSEQTDLVLYFGDGFVKEELKPDNESIEHSESSVLPTFSLLPLKHALAKLNQNMSGTEYNPSDLQHLSIVAYEISVNVDLMQLVEYFPTLHELVLSEVPIVKDSLSSLTKLTQLTNLDLSECNIGEQGTIAVAKSLANLPQLSSLNLTNNNIEEQGAIALAKSLTNLTQLNRLNLFGNNIGEQGAIALSQPLANLPQLTELNLWHNSIGEQGVIALSQPLANLPQLTKLDLGKNDIGEQDTFVLANSLANLPQLKVLSLDRNNINDDALKVLANTLIPLTKLETLDLSINPITNLAPLLPLIKRGIEVHSGYSETGIILDDSPITTPPPEIVEQGREAILNYFEEREAQDTVKLREAKLLIVGEPGVGKTSLVRRLTQPKQGLPAESETTKGIDIEALDVTTSDGETLKLNLWDFGGQEIYHSTHQFFLTKRSLYVLVDSSRTNDTGLSTGIHDERYRYWLDVVASCCCCFKTR